VTHVFGSFDADTSAGYLRDSAAFRALLGEVRQCLEARAVIGRIDIPTDLPSRDFSISAMEQR
jgi:hypothetical protein